MIDRDNNIDVLLIGGSAGSLEVVLYLLQHLRVDIPFSIIIIMHRKSNSKSTLAELLKNKSVLPVKEASDKESIKKGWVYLAPADYHLLVEPDFTISLDYSEKINYSRPSIDISFETAAEAYKEKAVGLILSGANSDGVNGLRAIQKSGGRCYAQDPSSAEVPFMPAQAAKKIKLDKIVSRDDLPAFINAL